MLFRLKHVVRFFRDLLFAFSGFLYDFFRFARYSGYKNSATGYVARYRLIKVYHAIEKSLSFRDRKASSGWAVATELMHRLKRYESANNGLRDFHAQAALNVLNQFEKASSYDCVEKNVISEFVASRTENSKAPGGAKVFLKEDLQKGKLETPEDFFFSRYSVRDYSSESIDIGLVERAVALAAKSPSACNRQAWHVYFTDKRKEIDLALSHQSGNKGFGQEVPLLLLITADLRAFDNAGERYQHWIDGGMFSMSIIYALHSLGLGSCCLNWSKGPVSDIKLRKCVGIPDEESLVMMLAVGYPNASIKVCESPREGVDSIFSKLTFKVS